MKLRFTSITATLAALTLAGAAFAASVTGSDGFTVDAAGSEAVIVINSTVFEIMHELGLGDRIIARDGASTFPENDLTDLGHFVNWGVEGVLSLGGDLVIAGEENMTPEKAEQLRSAGLDVLVVRDTATGGLPGLYSRIELLAEAFGLDAAGGQLIARIQQEVEDLEVELDALVARSDRVDALFIYSHSVGDTTIYGGPNTGPGILLRLAGLVDAGAWVNDAHVVITSEAVVTANPDVVVMLQRVYDNLGGVEGFLQLPSIALTGAGINEAVYVTDNTVRWIGPRFPEFARRLASDVYGLGIY